MAQSYSAEVQTALADEDMYDSTCLMLNLLSDLEELAAGPQTVNCAGLQKYWFLPRPGEKL